MLFLRGNGDGLGVVAPEAVKQVVRLASRLLDEVELAAWLRARAS